MKKNITNSQRILEVLQWTELEYGSFVLESGYAYLQNYIPGDEPGIKMLERSKYFWKWWRNHWVLRDEQFLSKIDDTYPAKTLARVYKEHHDVLALVNEIYPNAVVLGESYAVMIGNYIKEMVR